MSLRTNTGAGIPAPTPGPHHERLAAADRSIVWHIPALAVLSAILFYPALTGQCPSTHDFAQHVSYAQAVADRVMLGDLYPRWLYRMNDGEGSPMFLLQYPFPYYLLAALMAIVSTFSDIHQLAGFGVLYFLTFAGLSFFSALFCYFWLKLEYSSLAAFAGACGYLVVPYRYAVDSVIRGSLGEVAALAILPGIFYLLSARHGTRCLWVITRGVAIGLLILTHPITAALSVPWLFLAALPSIRWPEVRTAAWRFPPMLACGLLLASAYAVRFGVWKKTVLQVPLPGENWSYFNHFLFVPGVLFDRAARTLPAVAGPLQHVRQVLDPPLNLLVYVVWPVLISAMTMTAVVVCLLLCIWLVKGRLAKGNRPIIAAVCLYGVYGYFLFPLSAWIPSAFPALQSIQFPWRFLTPCTLLVPLLLCHALDCLRQSGIPAWRRKCGLFLAAFSFLLMLVTNALMYSRFTPLMDDKPLFQKDPMLSAHGGVAKVRSADDPSSPLAVWTSRSSVALGKPPSIRFQRSGAEVDLNVVRGGSLLFNHLCFDGLRLQSTNPSGLFSQGCNAQMGLVEVTVPEGSQKISFKYPASGIERVAGWVSIAGWILAIAAVTRIALRGGPA